VAASLREFAERDRDGVLELSRQALARPELQVGNPVWTTRDEMDSELADWDPPPEETLCVAEDDHHLVGFGGIEFPRGFDHAELFGPLVASAAQGQRLGTKLLEQAIGRAREGGSAEILAAVGTHNPAGQILLRSNGFRLRGSPQATFRLRPADHRPVEARDGSVVVRVARPEDLNDAIGLYRECFPEGRFPDAVWRANIDEGTVYAAEDAGRIVAVLNIDPADRWIYHVGVTETERKRGIGSYLLSRSLEDYWNRHPGEVLGLDVDASNVPAIRLYRRQGFAPWLVLQTFELPL
jgi:ribosomal protein S18 acetylase RimI-like enzyme